MLVDLLNVSSQAIFVTFFKRLNCIAL